METGKGYSVMQAWVERLGLRHQGVLLGAIRGCDSLPKEDASKPLARALRFYILNSYDENPKSFIDKVSIEELKERMEKVLHNFDHYPLHYIMHVIYAAEILGYKHPECQVRVAWYGFYKRFVRKLHLNVETEWELDNRLLAPEEEFEGCWRV